MAEKIRVMHIASGDLWAGAEAMLAALAGAQSRRPELALSAIVLNEGELARRLRALGVDTCVLPESSQSFASLCRAARARVRAVRPQFIHTHRIKEDLLGALASFGAAGAIRVRTVHGRDESANANSVVAKCRRAIHTLCIRTQFALSFAVSASLATELRQSLKHVAHVSNGIDVDSLRGLARREGRERSSPIRVGLVGRLVPVKRIDLFIGMAAQLQSRAPGAFLFHIYGDGPEQARLMELAARKSLGEVLRFEGFVTDAAARIAALDLLYLTSDSEGLPMTALEAMAVGTPVVSAAVGELPEVLDQGGAGTLVRRQHPEAYAEPALAFLIDRAPFLARARAAEQRLVARYSADACARDYLDHYRQLSGQA